MEPVENQFTHLFIHIVRISCLSFLGKIVTEEAQEFGPECGHNSVLFALRRLQRLPGICFLHVRMFG